MRLLYGVLILFALWTIYSSASVFAMGQSVSSISRSAVLANSFFVSFSWLQLGALLFAGPALAVGTIAAERERRTIEYLFATDLSNTEIILGKTFARLTVLGQLLLVGLPILYLFRLLGGIPASALAASFLCAASTAVLITAISTCVSVWSSKVRDATVRIYLLLIVLLLVPVILLGFQQLKFFPTVLWDRVLDPVSRMFMLVNPVAVLAVALGRSSATGLRLDMAQLLHAVGWQLVVSVLCIAWAAFAVRRVHLADAGRSASRIRRRWGMPRLPRFRLPLGDSPMIWKEMFSSTSATRLGLVGWLMILILIGLVLFWTVWAFLETIYSTASYRRDDYFEFMMGLAGFAGSAMLILLASRAAGLFTQEKERDCWLSLLSTPLSGRDIVFGKALGNLYSGRWILAVIWFSWLLGMFFEPTYWIAIAANLVTFLLLSSFVTLLGLNYSLRSPSTLRAMGYSLGTLLFVGGGYLLCCCLVLQGSGGGSEMAIFLAPCIPFLLIFPSGAFLSVLHNQTHWMDEGFSLAFALGMIGYAVATFLLFVALVDRFDELAGRTTLRPNAHPLS